MVMKNLAYLSILFVTVSCNTKTNDNITVIDTQSEKPSPHNLSEIFEKVDIVKLETSDTSLLSQIGPQIIKTDKSLFFYANLPIRRILKFDISGRFIKQIGGYGNGPGEYFLIYSICVDTVFKRIIAACNKEILCYDFDGNYLESIPWSSHLYSSGMPFLTYNQGCIWAVEERIGMPTENGKLMSQAMHFKINEKSQVTDSILIRSIKFDKIGTISDWSYLFWISELESGTYIHYPVSNPEPILRDTLFKIQVKDIIPVIKLDFSKILSVREGVHYDITKMSEKEFIETYRSIRNVTIQHIYRTERFVFVTYLYNGLFYFFCYDLIWQKGYHMSEGFTDDLYGTGIVRLIPLNLKENEFCFIKEGYELEGIIDGVNENSNPVIFFLRLKD